MRILLLISVFFATQVYAQLSGVDAQGFSKEMNKALPEIYDPVTKLMRTSVENQNFSYHFLLRATKDQYIEAAPKVRAQILKTVCSGKREMVILKKYKMNLVYRYENETGQELGEFMVRPEVCK